MRTPSASHRRETWLVIGIGVAMLVQTGLVFFELLT